MPSLEFTVSYRRFEGISLSPSDLLEQFLFGIPLKTKDGSELSMTTIREKIIQIQDVVTKFLAIKLQRQIVHESTDFERTDYNNWAYATFTYPMIDVISLGGWVGTVRQISYPLSWVSRPVRPEEQPIRQIHIVPAGTTGQVSSSVVFSGITPHLGFMGLQTIPNYWQLEYITGYTTVPPILYLLIGKLAAIEVLGLLTDTLLGLGVASFSQGVDGLSQSISKAGMGKGIFAARIEQWGKECDKHMLDCKNFFKGITFLAC
jgi:hypothetical protein